jgi:hypothetical protein
MAGPFLCGIALGLQIFSTPENNRNSDLAAGQTVKRLRWVMIGAMLFDMINTILGQPGSYWHHPGNVNESFALSRFLFNARSAESYSLRHHLLFSVVFRCFDPAGESGLDSSVVVDSCLLLWSINVVVWPLALRTNRPPYLWRLT